MANLWLAARIVQISARLPTTWPDIPYNLRLPVPFAAALIPAIGLIFVGHETASSLPSSRRCLRPHCRCKVLP
jgi:hypothetical protein